MQSETRPGRRRRLAGIGVAAGLGLGVLSGCGDDETAGGEVGTSVDDIQEPLDDGVYRVS